MSAADTRAASLEPSNASLSAAQTSLGGTSRRRYSRSDGCTRSGFGLERAFADAFPSSRGSTVPACTEQSPAAFKPRVTLHLPRFVTALQRRSEAFAIDNES